MRPASGAGSAAGGGARAGRPARDGGRRRPRPTTRPRRGTRGDARGTASPRGPAAACRTDRRAPARGRVRGGTVRRWPPCAFGIYPEPLLRPCPRRGRGDRLAGLGRERRPDGGSRRGRTFACPPIAGGSSPSAPAPRRRPGVARVRRAGRAGGHGARRGRAGGGARGVPGQVAAVVRTGVCIVGGGRLPGLRRAAAGLAPCTLSTERRGGGLAVTILSVRVGADHRWAGGAALGRLGRGDELARDDARGERRPRLRARAAEGRARRPRRADRGGGRRWELRGRGDGGALLAEARSGLSPRLGAGRPHSVPARPGWAPRAGRGSGPPRRETTATRSADPRAGIEVAAESAIGARIARGRTDALPARRGREGPRTTGGAGGRAGRRPGRPGGAPSTRATARARASWRSG